MNESKSINISVIISGLDEEYQNNIITGINDCARSKGINVSYFAAFGGMLDSKRFDIEEYSIYGLANYDFFDAVIFMNNTICDVDVKNRVLNDIRNSGKPALVFDCDEYPEMYNISIDNTSAMREIVRHVIRKHGAKTVNYISGPMSNPEARARLQAFREIMAENGLPVEESRIYYGEFRSCDGRFAIEKFEQSGLPLPDAFICANDAMALTAMSSLEKLGYSIPGDVIVTGFDNTYSARNNCPALTSVSRPLYEAGRKACEILEKAVNGDKPDLTFSLEASPVFTESCGCCSGSHADLLDFKKRAYARIENNSADIYKLNILAARLAESEEPQDNMNVISDFISELDCDHFALCLTSDWMDDFSGGDPEHSLSGGMTAPLIIHHGEVSSREYFSGREMFPDNIEAHGSINYFLPLHFRENVLGYYIMTGSDFPISSLHCHTFTMNVSNSIENIRKLMHLNKAMAELNRLYVIDPLCGIYNRNGFMNIVNDLFNECSDKNIKVMLTFIDMDGLKFINDNFGHNEGDFAIQRLADVIRECCRKDSVCARFGGDEFVIFDRDVSEGDAGAMERRFNAKIDSLNQMVNKPYTISASLGSITVTAGEDTTLYGIIKSADEKMYDIKRKKKTSRAGSGL